MSALEDKVKELEETLDKYETEKAGLPNRKQLQAPKYLYMSIDELRKKTPDELAEAAYELSLYSFELDRLINAEKARERWAKAKLDEFTALYLEDVGSGYGWNERILIAKHKPEACQLLNSFIRDVEMKLSRLYGIPKHIEIISKCIDNLRFIAFKREKGE